MTEGPTHTSDVLVVGGGAVGLSIALALVDKGAAVTVVDPSPGSHASSVAAGMLAPVTELHYGEDDLLRLNLRAAAMFGDWAAQLEDRTGTSIGYRRTGTLMVARDSDERAALERVWQHQSSLGLVSKRLKATEALGLEPALSPRIRGGVVVPDDHQVDPAAMVTSLLIACREAGVRFVREKVAGVRLTGGKATGVEVETGVGLGAGSVVVAAGPWTGAIGEVPPELRGVRPVKGQLLILKGHGTSHSLVSRNIRGEDVYMVPRADGRLVVGATVEEKGFDTSVTAGAVMELLRSAYELVPGIAEMDIVETKAGLRPGTPDNAPLLGNTSVDGLVVATGHYRNGILLAPLTGALIARLIDEGLTPPEIETFSPDRFVAAETRR